MTLSYLGRHLTDNASLRHWLGEGGVMLIFSFPFPVVLLSCSFSCFISCLSYYCKPPWEAFVGKGGIKIIWSTNQTNKTLSTFKRHGGKALNSGETYSNECCFFGQIFSYIQFYVERTASDISQWFQCILAQCLFRTQRSLYTAVGRMAWLSSTVLRWLFWFKDHTNAFPTAVR